jgi:hydrogenase maturation protease
MKGLLIFMASRQHNQQRVLIIGYGNPLRGDDGVGWHAANILAQEAWRGNVRVLARHQLTLELAAQAAEADLVVFIDARDDTCANDGEAAEVEAEAQVRCAAITPEPAAVGSMSHHLHPAALLACTQVLYGVCPAAVVCSVTMRVSSYGEELSPAVQAELPALLAHVRQLVEQASVRER